MANETLLLSLGESQTGVVVRLAPLEPTFVDYELGPQAAVQNAVAAAGVPAPAPAVVVRDPQWIGAAFLAMPLVEGRIPGPAPLFDQWLMGLGVSEQQRLVEGLLETLAGVHRVDWSRAGLGADLPERSLAASLDFWTVYVDWAGAGHPLPVLPEALAWCRERMPDEGDPVLLWGDARLGNLVLDERLGVRAVLDWDLTSLGPPEMDLGWHFGLEFMMEQLFGRRPPGFPSRQDALALYERSSGRAVLEENLAWHEVFALTRALAINDRHQRIAGSERRVDNPMAAILLARMTGIA
jgi:aminoglycoside phosphotransferase (APT) family kinase protein